MDLYYLSFLDRYYFFGVYAVFIILDEFIKTVATLVYCFYFPQMLRDASAGIITRAAEFIG